MSAPSEPAGSAQRSAFIPALLLALAVVGWATFQTVQLLVERNTLDTAIAGQETQMAQSRQVRERLESIAARTARVARSGNANATIIVEELRKRGITIDPDGPLPEIAPASQP